MKPKTLILMGLAITCGLGASYMTSQLLADRHSGDEEKVEILVAKRVLSVGDSIKKPDDFFEKKSVPAGQEPAEAIKDPEALKNKIMKRGIRKGDHVTPNDLLTDKDTLEIPEGHKAVGLRVNLEAIASGFATLPHSRVDVMLTVKRNDDKTSYVLLLLQDVLVLAADLITDRQTGIAAPAQVVTFALKPEEVFRVNMAKEMGSLTLALRKPTDRSKAETEKVTWEEMMAGGKKKTSGPDTAVAEKQTGPPRSAAKASDSIPSIAAKPSGEAKPPETAGSSEKPAPATQSASGNPSASPTPPVAEAALQGTHRELTIMNGKDSLRIPYTVMPNGQKNSPGSPPRKDAPKASPGASSDVL